MVPGPSPFMIASFPHAKQLSSYKAYSLLR
jgi:hypothetical protein